MLTRLTQSTMAVSLAAFVLQILAAGIGALAIVLAVQHLPVPLLLAIYGTGLVITHIVLFHFMVNKPSMWRFQIYFAEPYLLFMLVSWPMTALVAFVPEYLSEKLTDYARNVHQEGQRT